MKTRETQKSRFRSMGVSRERTNQWLSLAISIDSLWRFSRFARVPTIFLRISTLYSLQIELSDSLVAKLSIVSLFFAMYRDCMILEDKFDSLINFRYFDIMRLSFLSVPIPGRAAVRRGDGCIRRTTVSYILFSSSFRNCLYTILKTTFQALSEEGGAIT